MTFSTLFARLAAWARRAWQALRGRVRPPRPARFSERAFDTPFTRRHYRLFVPADLATQRTPLVLMLHGCKQDPGDFATGTRMNALAQERGWLVMYPEQIPRANAYRCWNWFRSNDQRRGHGEPALIMGMLQQVMTTHPVDPERVYVAGLSAGGAMAAILAREYPEVFAAVGVHSGLAHGAADNVISALTVMKHGPRDLPTELAVVPGVPGVPLIVFHGDQDATVHPRNGERLVAGHTAAEILPGTLEGGRSFVRTTYGDADGRVIAEHWLVHGSGHAWSGGDPQGSFTDPDGPNASREMLRFFAQHKLNP
jgi:poly(hydroxyalkanoate) depolymerase family esterase